MAEVTGGCFCGRVRWRARGAPTRNLVCHCTSCRRATGSPFTAFTGYRAEDVELTGTITDYSHTAGARRGFCPACGTRICFRSDNWPGEIHLHLGTLDDPAAYRPTAQVLCDERMDWLDTIDAIPAHRGFERPPAMGKRT